MLAAILVIGGVALLSKGAKKMAEPPGNNGQFSTTGMAASVNAKKFTARGISTFTPSEQTPAIPQVFTLPPQSFGDPNVGVLKTTMAGTKAANPNIIQMLSEQRFYEGGYK